MQRWSATADYAERLQDGRIFIAGDAAHVMPPTGGFGGNCGVQDAYDLAWKLAYVLDGRADERLLSTYDTERQPVGAFTTEQAYTRYVLRLDPSLGKENLLPIVEEATVELGYRYRSPAVTGIEADDATWEDPREPSGRPGFRAPHVTIARDGVECSTLDLFGTDFVVLAGAGGADWCTAARSAGDSLGVVVDAYRVDADIADATGSVAALYGTGGDGAALIRPDGFVAWRASAAEPDPEGALTRALRSAIGR